MRLPSEESYIEELEERIIQRIMNVSGCELSRALEIYYNSRLAGMIAKGDTGVQYLDYKYLVNDILDNQKSLCGV